MASSLVTSLAFGQTILIRYVESFLFALGTTGSILNILLFSQRKLQSNSCCTYFLGSSIAAFILIQVAIIPQLYTLSHSPDPLFNRSFCKAQGYITQSGAMLCRWLLTVACVDRCLLSSTNARLRLFSTVHTARRVIIFLSIIWLILPVHIIIFADVRIPGYIACIMVTNGAALYHSIYTIILGGLLPPLIMLTCTYVIWKNLELKRQRQGRISLNRRTTRREVRDTQVLIMLLSQVTIFVVFNIPYMSFNLYLALTRTITNKPPDRLAIESFLQLLTQICAFIHPAASFCSNTLASQTFRKELKIVLWRIFTCGYGQPLHKRQRVGPNTITTTHTKRNDLPMIVIN